MMPPGTFSAILASVSATRRFSSSLSRTQGPAMRKSLSAGNISATLFSRLYRRTLATTSRRRLRLHRGADEARKERMWTCGARLKLGVELAADVPRMGLELDDLDERAVRRQATEIEPVLDELVPVLVVYLVAMAVPFTHLGHAVDGSSLRPVAQSARVC